MKGQISQYGFKPKKRFSGLYLQQGRMVTDSDQIILNEIHKNRVDALGDDAVKSGVPAVDGMVDINVNNVPALQVGDVYVDGIRGRFEERRKKGLRSLRGKLLALGANIGQIKGKLKQLTEDQIAGHLDAIAKGTANIQAIISSLPPAQPITKDLIFFYQNQADFPCPPELKKNKLLYVDLWERPVFWFEDGDLVDPGWHGADTAFRTRTMVQVKTAPPNAELGKGKFPKKGNALLASVLATGTSAKDPCDPCADELNLPARTGNQLVRLEVLDVIGPVDKPTEVLLAWSEENASLAFPVDTNLPPEFADADHVYEFFSEVTESHQGVFENHTTRKKSHVAKGFPPNLPPRTDGMGTGQWPFVRRWDGYVRLKLSYNTTTGLLENPPDLTDASHPQVLSLSPAKESLRIKSGQVQMSLRYQINGNPRDFVAGDYWLTRVRENGIGIDRVNEVSRWPIGITHHYLPLFTIDSGKNPAALNDENRRKLSFPPLTDIPADHVGYDDHCANHFQSIGPAAENVQQALDRMCKLKAEHIGYDDQCPDKFGESVDNVQLALNRICHLEAKHIHFSEECPDLFGEAGNVQEALGKLCDLNASHIKFDNPCPDVFGEETKTVQDALNALCDSDCCDDHNRYFHDWGAVCGLKVFCSGTTANMVTVLPGAMVDQTGHLSVLKESIEQKFEPLLENLSPEGRDLEGLVLAIEYIPEEETHKIELLTKEEATKLAGQTFMEKFKVCESDFETFFDVEVSYDEEKFHENTIEAIDLILKNIPSRTDPVPPLFKNQPDYADLKRFFAQRVGRLRFLTSCSTNGRPLKFPGFAEAKDPVNVINAFIKLINAAHAAERDCKCAALIPDCPSQARRNLVPLCEIKFDWENKEIIEISNVSCRKFCLTWRSFRYWLDPYLDIIQKFVAGNLCDLRNIPLQRAGEPTFTGGLTVDVGTAFTESGYVTVNPNLLNQARPGVNYYDLMGLSEDEAVNVAEMRGFFVEEVIKYDTLETDRRLEAYESEFTANELFKMNGKADQGTGLRLLSKGNKIVNAIPVKQPAKEEKSPGARFGAFSLSPSTPEIQTLMSENRALMDEVAAVKEELKVKGEEVEATLANMSNSLPVSFLVSDPELAGKFYAAGVKTAGDMKGLSAARKRTVMNKTGAGEAEMKKLMDAAKKGLRG